VYAQRYLGMAMINELAVLTPSNIRIVDLNMKLMQVGEVPAGPPAKGAPPPKAQTKATLSVDGLIFGEQQIFETSLVGYMMALEASPLFSQVMITKSNMEPYPKGGAFHFILNFKVEG
jgi:hypothetical protein